MTRSPLINLCTWMSLCQRTFKRHDFVPVFMNKVPKISESIRSQRGDTARARKRGSWKLALGKFFFTEVALS